MMKIAAESNNSAQWTEQHYAHIFHTSTMVRRHALVCGQEGPVLGFAVARQIELAWELENIAVASGSRRSGKGTDLLRALIALARDRGAERMWLEVRDSNAVARRLYEKCGFASCGRRRAYYPSPVEDAILYELELAPLHQP